MGVYIYIYDIYTYGFLLMKLIGDNHRCPSKRNHIQFNWDLVFQVSDLCLIKFSQMGIDHQYGGKYIYIYPLVN